MADDEGICRIETVAVPAILYGTSGQGGIDFIVPRGAGVPLTVVIRRNVRYAIVVRKSSRLRAIDSLQVYSRLHAHRRSYITLIFARKSNYANRAEASIEICFARSPNVTRAATKMRTFFLRPGHLAKSETVNVFDDRKTLLRKRP